MVVFEPMGKVVGDNPVTLAWYDESPQSVHFKFKLPPSTMGSWNGERPEFGCTTGAAVGFQAFGSKHFQAFENDSKHWFQDSSWLVFLELHSSSLLEDTAQTP